MSDSVYLSVSTEVKAALSRGQPVVALESTIIAHGMPFPQNLEVARRLERMIREEGAVPATLCVWQGKWQVGMSDEQLEAFARKGEDMPKASRRDLPVLSARGLDGATTVAATMIMAHRAGIRFFATGGIGGVHRAVEQSMDISADLQELARTPVAVISAGAKAILDLPRTLEYLETMGVPVLGYGTSEFPAFYTRTSGLPLEWRVDSPEEAAAVLRAHWDLDLGGGVLIANPIPEAFGRDKAEMDKWIEQAIREAESLQISGKKLTPFLLARLEELSAGASLVANQALVEDNARLAARIAGAFSVDDK